MSARLFLIAFMSLGLVSANAAPKPKTRSVEAISQRVYDKITDTQKLSKQKKYQEALATLNSLLKNDTINHYERAIILQQKSFVWVEKENFTQAAQLLRESLAMNVLSKAETRQAQFNLAQIYVAEQNYTQAIKILDAWVKDRKKTSGAGLALLAQAWALSGDIKRATPYAAQAVQSAKKPRKSWLRLLISLYLQQEFYVQALPIAASGAALYPQDEFFWLQLAALYAERKQAKKSFAALRTMHQLGLFTKSAHYTRLAQSYLAFDNPLAGARLLEEGFAKNIVEKNHKNYTLLGDAWLLARAWQKAIPPLRQAAPLVKHGKVWQRLGRGYMEMQQWQKAEKAFVRALAQAGLRDEGRTWLLLGIARVKQNKQTSTFAALDRAITFDSVSSEAKAWIDNLRAQK
jgi:tetratricopeptide (TPR) repeat protein